jgi:hypothetical protein
VSKSTTYSERSQYTLTIPSVLIPIAIKSALTDNSKSTENNANPKIRNNVYVTMFLSFLDSLNLQSNQGVYQREFKKIRASIKGVKSSSKGFLFVLSKR